jgi:DNA-binding transcriptional ArsR family regulator
LIRFHADAAAAEHVAFAYSPLLEAVQSLHVLAEPKHHPLQHPWVRAMRGLPPSLKRELTAFAFLWRWTIPNCFLPEPGAEQDGFDEELERLTALGPETLAVELVRTVYDFGDARPSFDGAFVAAARAAAARLPKPAPSSVNLLLERPEEGWARVRRLLEDYWLEAFGAEWERIEHQLADAVTDAGTTIARDGLYSFFRALVPGVLVDDRAGWIGRDVPHDHDVEIGATRPLILVPSVYAWPHVRVNCDEPWPASIVYGAPAVARHGRSLLRAVADPIRLRALQLLVQRPRSTQELAPLLGIGEAGASKHLRKLADAGLVTTRREGYYVVYSLAPGRVDAIAGALAAALEDAG